MSEDITEKPSLSSSLGLPVEAIDGGGGKVNQETIDSDIADDLLYQLEDTKQPYATVLGFGVRRLTLADVAILLASKSSLISQDETPAEELLFEIGKFLLLVDYRITIKDAYKIAKLPKDELEDKSLDIISKVSFSSVKACSSEVIQFINASHVNQPIILQDEEGNVTEKKITSSVTVGDAKNKGKA